MNEITRIVNNAIQTSPELKKLFQTICPRTPSYRYYSDKKNNRYCWTTEKVKHQNGGEGYATWVYKYKKAEKVWKMEKKRVVRQRTKAKCIAIDRYNRAKGEKEKV